MDVSLNDLVALDVECVLLQAYDSIIVECLCFQHHYLSFVRSLNKVISQYSLQQTAQGPQGGLRMPLFIKGITFILSLALVVHVNLVIVVGFEGGQAEPFKDFNAPSDVNCL